MPRAWKPPSPTAASARRCRRDRRRDAPEHAAPAPQAERARGRPRSPETCGRSPIAAADRRCRRRRAPDRTMRPPSGCSIADDALQQRRLAGRRSGRRWRSAIPARRRRRGDARPDGGRSRASDRGTSERLHRVSSRYGGDQEPDGARSDGGQSEAHAPAERRPRPAPTPPRRVMQARAPSARRLHGPPGRPRNGRRLRARRDRRKSPRRPPPRRFPPRARPRTRAPPRSRGR